MPKYTLLRPLEAAVSIDASSLAEAEKKFDTLFHSIPDGSQIVEEETPDLIGMLVEQLAAQQEEYLRHTFETYPEMWGQLDDLVLETGPVELLQLENPLTAGVNSDFRIQTAFRLRFKTAEEKRNEAYARGVTLVIPND